MLLLKKSRLNYYSEWYKLLAVCTESHTKKVKARTHVKDSTPESYMCIRVYVTFLDVSRVAYVSYGKAFYVHVKCTTNDTHNSHSVYAAYEYIL